MTEEEEAKQELLLMKPGELELVPYDFVWWVCCCKGCNNAHRVKDFGISPQYYSKQFRWFDITEQLFFCGKHWKWIKRLEKKYEPIHIGRKLFDLEKPFIISNNEKIRTKNMGVKLRIASVLHKKPKRL